ncbi:MAG: 4-hydroxy-tetrahydrodipicolinate synthase [Deltaproteobacteria bacterium]|nr:MAG: 4-hydroxy-tetrahydrodipicolinate synthase [Deltaproteobacteria bacterium]
MTALVTPMRDGAVDFPALDALVERQLEAGIDGLVAVGTTGESATLAPPEHVAVVRRVVEVARGRVPVVAGAGANSTAEAVELSIACREAGADALLHVTPYYNKPTQQGLYVHFEAVARAGRLPVVLYNVPGRTSCDLLPETVERLAAVDYIVAIKEATGSVARATEIIERCGDRIAVLSGDDFTAFALYAVGARGVISVVSNVAPAWMADMWDAARDGDWDRARQLHYRIQPLTRLLFAEPNPIPVKAALALLGHIGPEIRPPLVECSPALRDRLRDRLAEDGLA